MRLVADESCDAAVVRALRAAGYDVVAIAEVAPGAADSTVIDLARDARRLLITEDKDFWSARVRERQTTAGVLLLRYPATARRALAEDVRRRGERLAGTFVVMQPGRVRISGGLLRTRRGR
jgi:predicted nuclease of predicted toxin-antitoxin system